MHKFDQKLTRNTAIFDLEESDTTANAEEMQKFGKNLTRNTGIIEIEESDTMAKVNANVVCNNSQTSSGSGLMLFATAPSMTANTNNHVVADNVRVLKASLSMAETRIKRIMAVWKQDRDLRAQEDATREMLVEQAAKRRRTIDEAQIEQDNTWLSKVRLLVCEQRQWANMKALMEADLERRLKLLKQREEALEQEKQWLWAQLDNERRWRKQAEMDAYAERWWRMQAEAEGAAALVDHRRRPATSLMDAVPRSIG